MLRANVINASTSSPPPSFFQLLRRRRAQLKEPCLLPRWPAIVGSSEREWRSVWRGLRAVSYPSRDALLDIERHLAARHLLPIAAARS
jgi:hypothetical protein